MPGTKIAFQQVSQDTGGGNATKVFALSGLRVERCLCQKHRVLLRSDTQLVVEGVVPDLLLKSLRCRAVLSGLGGVWRTESPELGSNHCLVPFRLHVIPVRDDAVLDGVLQGQHTSPMRTLALTLKSKP